jgi:para-aminobenzoate synthetase component 1
MMVDSSQRDRGGAPQEVADMPPVIEELTSPPPPMDAARRLAGLPRLLFLDSARVSPPLGQYSFLTADPFWFLSGRNGQFTSHSGEGGQSVPQVFDALNGLLGRFPARAVPGLPPFQGGLAGLFSYDLGHQVENIPWPAHDEFAVPEIAVGAYDWVLAYDLAAGRAWMISHGFPETLRDRRERRAQERAGHVRQILSAGYRSLPVPQAPRRPGIRPSDLATQYPVPGAPNLTSNFTRTQYLRAVERVLEYIRAGDVFQVNLSQRLLHPEAGPPLALYERLRASSQALFGGYLEDPSWVLLSSSPERFLRVDRGHVETCPIKGTRPRGLGPAEDEAQRLDLRNNPKDRAENVMIVDLLRNDLSRVCRPGTVRVPELFRVDTLPYVHHLVSVVTGELESGRTPVDLLRAAFPGGSVTGAPKVRAMEIIAEIEPTARGPYCGCLGYIGFDGSMDTNILIRTMTSAGGWLQFPVGGGIVADSDPEREYEETLHKARALLGILS